jgi:hypothetical protein
LTPEAMVKRLQTTHVGNVTIDLLLDAADFIDKLQAEKDESDARLAAVLAIRDRKQTVMSSMEYDDGWSDALEAVREAISGGKQKWVRREN